MKKFLPVSLLLTLLLSTSLFAQTTGTYVVADNGASMSSCSDTLITLADIFEQTGIRDLNDPNDDVSMYKMFRLEGSVITEDELTSIKYSDYPAVFIQKMNATNFHNSGIQIFLYVITPPTSLFTVDTLKYTVDKGATVNYSTDFFGKFIFFSSGKDVTDLNQRILFTDQSIGTEAPIGAASNWTVVGKGKYKIRVQVAVCSSTDYFYDSIYVIVNETPCLKMEIKNMPSVCRDEIIDITPYLYVDGHKATASDLDEMTFTNKSDLGNPTGAVFDPTEMDMTTMVDKIIKFPKLEITYQPNVDFGVCSNYSFMPTTKVPTKLISTDLVITKNNYGAQVNYFVEGDYYGINDMFSKTIIKKLYLDNFSTAHAGTTFDYYSDNTHQSFVSGDNLTPGTYYIVATNSGCDKDTTLFTINVKNKDFDIVWQGAPNIGKGYYTFSAPIYAGATYAWFVWGGSIISGINTNQATIYYSENAAPAVTVSCTITLPTASNARVTSDDAPLKSAVYITSNGSNEKVEITAKTPTPVITTIAVDRLHAFPNPAKDVFALSGSGTYEVKIYNTLGQLIYENPFYSANTPIQMASKGMLVAHITQKGNSQVIKVVME